MKNEEERLRLLDELFPMKQESCLVFGINREGIITRFNDDFELLIGKSKEEVINKPISTFFADDPQLLDRWMDVIAQARANKPINDVELPLQTKSGDDIVVSWTNFPINEQDGTPVSVLNLVGTPIVTTSSSYKSSSKDKGNKNNKSTSNEKEKSANKKQKEQKINQEKQKKSDKTTIEGDTENNQNQSEIKKKKKKLKISKKPKQPKKSKEDKKESSPKKPTEKKKLFSKKRKDTSESLKKEYEESEKQKKEEEQEQEKIKSDAPPSIDKKSLRKNKKELKKAKKQERKKSILQKKKDTSSAKTEPTDLSKLIKELERENERLQKENSKLEQKLEHDGITLNNVQKVISEQLKFLLNSIGISKRREEFNQMMNQMQDRKLKLEHLETDMILEKKEFKQKIEEFFEWREKLEQLEQEIEKRRQYLNEQETFLNEQYDKVLNYELETPASYVTEVSEPQTDEMDEHAGVVEEEDLFESLAATAAVLQRGRIKKVNKLFLDLLGYTEKDLIGKHLVDFVSPLGLSGIEQHYVNRLKGVDDLSYTTVFLTKNQDEIAVKVSVKTGEFLGQRAEIATFHEQ